MSRCSHGVDERSPQVGTPFGEHLDCRDDLLYRPVVERVEPILDEPEVHPPHADSLEPARSTIKFVCELRKAQAVCGMSEYDAMRYSE